MQPTKTYVRKDEQGVMRVGESRVMLDVVAAAYHEGHSAETIAQQYPAITLEEIYGAIAYYLANKEEVDQYLRRQDEIWKQWREKANQTANPVVQRLRSHAAKAGRRMPHESPTIFGRPRLEHIVTGTGRREPALEFLRLRDLGMSEFSDAAILDYADHERLLVVSQDINTMPATAYS